MSKLNSEKMRAVRIHRYGGLDQLELETIETPTPGAGEVLVKVHAAAINPVDWKIREGYLAEMLPHSLPLTLGWDFSGEVAALGEGVEHWRVGDAVYARPDISKNGSYADYIVVSASEIAAKPKTLDWQHAAAVPLATLTAWQVLFDAAHIKEGDRVLIQAGAGGVGFSAIQLAKHAGATVYTTASTKNIEFLKNHGADEVIDYTKDDFTQIKDLDIVFDTLGGEALEKSWASLKTGGRLVSIVEPPSEELAEKHGVEASFCFVQPNAEQLTKIAELIDSGVMKVEIDSVYSLEDTVKAMEKSQTGHARGKIVIQVS